MAEHFMEADLFLLSLFFIKTINLTDVLCICIPPSACVQCFYYQKLID